MVNSVLKAVKILETIGEGKPLGASEIGRKLDIPKSSVHNILQTLESEGFVEKGEDASRYNLGISLIELGYRAQNDLAICQVATPYLNGINGETGETIHLTVLDNDEVLYVGCVESIKTVRAHAIIGLKAPLYCTSVGKAIMAFLHKDHIERIIREKGLEKRTKNTITEKSKLLDDLKKTRERGYSIDNMEIEDHLTCIGAPIMNHKGEVFASISISAPTGRLTKELFSQYGLLVKNTTDQISRKLGFRKLQSLGL